jgi:hypothetical protein
VGYNPIPNCTVTYGTYNENTDTHTSVGIDSFFKQARMPVIGHAHEGYEEERHHGHNHPIDHAQKPTRGSCDKEGHEQDNQKIPSGHKQGIVSHDTNSFCWSEEPQ